MYKKNQKGENVINIPKILKKNDLNIDKYDRIINEYIKAHRPVKVKRVAIDIYECEKKRALDDDILAKKNHNEKLSEANRSKSFMRLKGIFKCKGILKPIRSFVALKSNEKKIQFGEAEVQEYHLKKKK